MFNAPPRPVYLKDYRPPAYLIDTTHLDFDLQEDHVLVRSRLALRANHDHTLAPEPLRLDGEELELLEVKLDGGALPADRYQQDPQGLTLPQVPEQFQLEITTRIYPQKNTSLEGLYQSSGNFCTQCEAQGFRKITYYLDRPDVMARFTTHISASRKTCPVLLSNGNPVASESLDDGRHAMTWDDPFPKPSYLFALVAGDLVALEDCFTTRSGKEVELRLYVQARNRALCGHAMASLKKAMAWDEEIYGREYDLDIYMIVAVDDFNMGAMENKGLNVFNSKYVLADPATATDRDFEGVEGVIAHEYFHNWTGNRITCRDWFQLSLKEGLTVFRDQEFSADMTSRPVKRIQDVRVLRAHQFPEDAGPMAHPVRPESYIEMNNFYTVTVYNKGAEVIRMIHTLLGAAGFRRGTDLYFQRHDGQAVTTDDFVAAMADANGVDFTTFKRWYYQSGTPHLKVRGRYEPEQARYTLQVSQTCPPTPGQPHKEPFVIPLRMALLDPDGNPETLRLQDETSTALQERVLVVDQDYQEFVFEGIERPPVPSLLRGFSAPILLDAGYTEQQLAFLMGNDNDPFNRWDDSQELATRQILQWTREGGQGEAPEAIDAAFLALLTDPALDDALRAEALSLPSESYVAEAMEVIDVEGIHHARTALMQGIGRSLRRELLAVYRRCQSQGDYQFTPKEVGRRALRKVCLSYLMESGDAALQALAWKQFQNSDNMTDTMAALTTLAGCDCPQRLEALERFYQRWQDQPLVIDKWFSVQATSPLPGTLEAVKKLMEHPAFKLTNPNRARALIGAFASANPLHFHAADGSGYRFLADQILALDPLNPQVAARMTGPFTHWRRHDGNRQDKIRQQLQRILSHSDLSSDVYEIASKALG